MDHEIATGVEPFSLHLMKRLSPLNYKPTTATDASKMAPPWSSGAALENRTPLKRGAVFSLTVKFYTELQTIKRLQEWSAILAPLFFLSM